MVTEAFYRAVHDQLWQAEQFEKRASHDPSDENLTTKTTHDVQLFEKIKTAIDWGSVRSVLGGAGKSVGKGALIGTGAALPAAAAGSYLINDAAKAQEGVAKNVIEDVRNKALQAALGVGAVGVGLMGAHRLISRPDTPPSQVPSNAVDPTHTRGLTPGYKQGSVEEEALLEKLAAVGYLDVMLGAFKPNTKLGEEARICRVLNAEHGIHVLRQLLT